VEFALSEEQELLRRYAREYLSDRHPLDRVAAHIDTEPGWDPGCWKEIAGLGWLGEDLGPVEQMVLAEETGYALLPAPLFATVGLALAAVEHDPALRTRVAGGDLRLTLAWAEPGRPQGLRATDAATTVDGDGRVTGRKVLVPDAEKADAFAVTAHGAHGVELCLVEAGNARITPHSTSDRSRRMAEVEFADAPSESLAGPETTPAVLAGIERRAMVLAAAEALGVGRHALELGVAHARERHQFGRPIGVYQGVSHRLVDGYAALEMARSLTYWAAWLVAEGDDGGDRNDGTADAACAAAKSRAGEAAVLTCEHAIQVTGGLGMTWEHPLHRLYKRALWLDAFAGNGRDLRARIADTLL